MQEDEIFLAAIEIEDPAARERYLDEVCPRPSHMRRRVDSLLCAHASSGPFLQVPVLRQIQTSMTEQIVKRTVEDAEAVEAVDLSFLTPSENPKFIGRLNRFEIERVIGRGGCGIVFKGFDEQLHRVVAIKVMAPELAATSPARKRFLREARATASVRHENVVNIYAVEHEPLPFLVMEYVDGQTLQQKLDETGPLELREIIQIGYQLSRGLAAAHAKGLIHRDIKPANILLERGVGRLKITDFGLARTADDASISHSGLIAGTPLYMSPEQAQAQTVDARSDLFSLGSVLYVMCTGRPPFRASTLLSVIKRVVEDQPRPIPEIIPEIPEWLVELIGQLHAKSPDQRPPTALAVAKILKTNGREGGLTSRQDAGTAEADPSVVAEMNAPRFAWLSRPRLPWIMAAGALLAVLLGVGLTDASGVTEVSQTMIRLFRPEGTLVIEVDDPDVSVRLDNDDVVIAGAGVRELRLSPGRYQVRVDKDGHQIRQELVTVSSRGRQLVRIAQEAPAGPAQASMAVQTPGLPAQTPGATPSAAVATGSALLANVEIPVPSHWEGTRTYRRGAFAPATVTYFLEMKHRSGNRFTGAVFDNGYGRNPAEVEGEINGAVLTWRERANGNVLRMQATLDKDQLQVDFAGLYANGARNVGDGVLTLKRPVAVKSSLPEPAQVSDKPAVSRRPMDVGTGEWQGAWRIENNELLQAKAGKSELIFGDVEWTNYDVSVEMRTESTQPDAQGGVLLFRAQSLDNFYALTVGNFGGDGYDLTREINGTWSRIGPYQRDRYQPGRWYQYEVHVRGSQIRALVDGVEKYNVSNVSFLNGMVGLATWNSSVRWRNLQVTSPGGQRLWEGFPDLSALTAGEPAPDVLAAAYVTSLSAAAYIKGIAAPVTDQQKLPAPPYHLIGVDFHRNQNVTPAGLENFRGTTQLQFLKMSAINAINDDTLAYFAGNRQLDFLDIAYCSNVTSRGLEHLRDLKMLRVLWLFGTRIRDDDLTMFRDNDVLTLLGLSSTPIGDAGLAHVVTMKKLLQLEMDRTSITDDGLKLLARCPTIIRFTASHTQVTDAGLTHLSGHSGFEYLDFSQTAVTDAGLKALQDCSKLSTLVLTGTKVTQAGIEEFAKAMPECEITWDGGKVERTRGT